MPRTIASAAGTDSGKRHPLNMRTTQELRQKLEAAAAASGRSLAQEVEYRLERSFADGELVKLVGERVGALLEEKVMEAFQRITSGATGSPPS